MKFYALALLTLALTGCAAVSRLEGAGSATAPRFGTLQLNQTLTIPAHRGWVYVQGGQVYANTDSISLQGVDQYYTNCRVELRSINSDTLTLQPQKFHIISINHDEEFVRHPSVMVAALDSRMAFSTGPMIMITSFYLDSAQEPQVWRLRCARWDDPWNARYPSIAQIRKTLGKVFTLQPRS